jgi:4-hydroxy-tetrahydrodipicolinate synthase
MLHRFLLLDSPKSCIICIMFTHLHGVYAAALTPLNADLSIDPESMPRLLGFLAQRGCHGVLLLGTTGEGPSFAAHERISLFRAALAVREEYPNLRLLAGTGTPSLEETITLTRGAFDLGYDGVVVLPPYYFKKVPDEGLFAWFRLVIEQAVPAGGALFGYHFPSLSMVPFSPDLLARLKDAFPDRFAGIKDSSGDLSFAQSLGERFGSELVVLNGNDRLFSQALDAHASGCITAMANLHSPGLRRIWDARQRGERDEPAQAAIAETRLILESKPPFPPLLKALLHAQHNFPRWPVRPPLLPTSPQVLEDVLAALNKRQYDSGI